MLRHLFVMSQVLLLFASSASAGEWSLVKNSDDIRVYSRKAEGSEFNEMRAVTTLNANMVAVVGLLRDYEARNRWDGFSGETLVYKIISPTEELVYLHSDLPWPVSDRDMLMHVRWSQNSETGVVSMESSAMEYKLAPQADRVRVTNARQSWTLTPAGEGKIELRAKIFLDPAGPLPGWLLNTLSVETPYDAFNKIRNVLKEGGFSQSGAEFVQVAG